MESIKTQERHYIIGYLGSDRMLAGEKLAAELDCPLLNLDEEIERLDGRSIRKICMINGEHAYRNKEYEVLSKLSDSSCELGLAKNECYPDRLVVVCGDGTILDEMSLEILCRAHTLFVDTDPDLLWERIQNSDPASAAFPYAFLYGEDLAEKERVFREMYRLRLPLYRKAAGLPTEL